MGLKQELDTIRYKTAALLDECNAVAKLLPADNLSDVPRLITEAEAFGYSEGDAAGFESGSHFGAGSAKTAVLQKCNPVLEKYTAPVDTVEELPAKIDEVHSVGVAAGEQAAYDAFWDNIQASGSANDYRYAFGGRWSDDTFRPKHDFIMMYVERMFAYSHITDLKSLLEKQGVSLVWKLEGAGKAANVTQMFQQSAITRLPMIDVSQSASIDYMFYNARALQYIEKLKVPADGSMSFNSNVFQNCNALADIDIEGVIGKTITFQWCPLSRASIESVVAALSDDASGQTLTLKQTAVDAAFAAEEWAAIKATKPNWTIETA